MKYFNWNAEKNEILIKQRNVSFEEVVFQILNDRILDILEHPNTDKYPEQKIFVIEIRRYIYLIPFVENENEVFLKTIIPSRKFTKLYLKEQK